MLNAKLLSSMISRMPAGQISILSADNGKTTIKSGVAEFEIQSMAATDFPDLPNTGAEETLTIPTGVLRDMIDRTLYAVSQDEKKPAHTGELFEIEPDKLTIVALDGYRLAIVERPVRVVDEFNAQCEGDEVEIGFNNRYLLDALRNARTEQVRMEISGPLSPVKVLPVEGSDFLYLVLPVRFKND